MNQEGHLVETLFQKVGSGHRREMEWQMLFTDMYIRFKHIHIIIHAYIHIRLSHRIISGSGN